MANQNKNNATKNNKRNHNNNRGRNRNKERNNFQDRFSDAEFDKGKRFGESKSLKPVNCKSSDNDSSWYIPKGMTASDVLSIPETVLSGSPIPMTTIYSGTTWNYQAVAVPGIRAFHIISGLPEDSTRSVSPINQAGSDLYQAIQAANSRNPVYSMPLLLMYIYAHADVLAYYQFLTRIYGVIRNYSMFDVYTPKALCSAMNVNFDSIKNNLADFRIQINQLADAIRSLVIPSTIQYLERKIFLYSNIYTDSSTSKAQYYMYVPEGFYQWVEGQGDDPAGNPGLTYLQFQSIWKDNTYTDWTKGTLTADQLIEFGWQMVDALRNSEDVRWIGADLLKAFGVNAMYTVQGLDETFSIQPVYNAEVLSQMENAFIYPGVVNAQSAPKLDITITQDPGIGPDLRMGVTKLVQHSFKYQVSNQDSLILGAENQPFEMSLANTLSPSVYLLNFHKDSVSSEEMMVASRFTSAVPIQLEGSVISMTLPNTEIICGMYTYYWDVSPGTSTNYMHGDVKWSHQAFGNEQGIGKYGSAFYAASAWSKFDWSPAMFMHTFVKDPNTAKNYMVFYDMMFDLDNYYVIPHELMKNVNYTALLGLFVPSGLPNLSM